ncbi:16S rRNA (guanine(527)-N(7))-methyltransferase RsmG [Wenzhouxiangella limi]|uniref:Ribosomal RNA small subunit methyltransferase G n=1 Tax=Wenzhouxiangella limi TaxID=2707351 RepID=A0A845V2K2_9GAMM|nr:16S rRNA (guanine(527)-N(7))-methyltransferase RsmG [Wenzhouxiangella limi]NDY94235.1 16S rRNA (guanine(527)-N(7))-methyltransferase RsmG [Wenzhouxiangella limi]
MDESLSLPRSLENCRGQLGEGLDRLGLAGPARQEDLQLRFLALMQRWNRSFNLTALSEPGEMVARHLLDSLALLPYLRGSRFVDAGTGPGLPGVPLAIACPDCHFVLLDSNGKKIRFLNQVRRDLGLGNIEPVQARLEDYRSESVPDAILARALAPLERLVGWTGYWLDRGVPLLAMKGDLSESERRAVPAPYNVSLVELEIPGLRARRCLATVEKQ